MGARVVGGVGVTLLSVMRWMRANDVVVCGACVVLTACGGGGGGGGGRIARPERVPGTVVRDVARAGQPAHEGLARDTMERIDAVMGGAFVVPVDPALLRDALASGKPLRLLLDDGLELPSTLYRASVSPTPANTKDPWDLWLGQRVEWHSAVVTLEDAGALLAGDDVTTGFALLVEPKAGRSDNAVWVGSERVPMQWLGPVAREGSGWDSPLPAGAKGQGQVMRAIAQEALNPLTRWRASLLEPGRQVERFDDALQEALAHQQEHRWRVALAGLWSMDRGLCERVKRCIAGVAVVSPGVYAPVWETDQASLDRLLLDLTNAHTSGERRVQLAEQWLRERPSGAAWIVDEGGSFTDDGPSAQPGAVVTMVNLTGDAQTAWASMEGVGGERSPREMRAVPAMECVVDLRALSGGSRAVRAHVGEWSRTLPVLPMPIVAKPPGVVTGLFVLDMDAPGLLMGGVSGAGEPEWATAATLHRPARTEATMPEHRRWEVYVECMCPAGVDRSGESLLVVTGAFGRASASWRVGHDGSITSLRTQDAAVLEELGSEVARATVTDLPDRWVARVPVPPGSLEDGRLLRIGLSREDARGVRSGWPRPMTPWQEEPARACVDVSGWGE